MPGCLAASQLGKLFKEHPVVRFHASKTAGRRDVRTVFDPEISGALSIHARQAIETAIEQYLEEQYSVP